ncbi:anaerobic sulfatase maturase [Treponema parvum]|uniref:anaerobic sulfatase maturase n=1 Tax=Treponema parvum TaxID=138851 RepID=UPI001AEC1F42|nr:anaerobic sulfatase maturase [Treponema parvum]QTQ17108.1 anaerobic sulfatase maturase [Treponema parvum]
MSPKKHRVLLIKPASCNCNMVCKYCFYIDESENRNSANYGIMTKETAHKIIDRAVEENDEITFSFQGGEPTCAGFSFFEDFVSYCFSKKKDKTIHFALQTNGFIVDRKWAEFFKKNNFLIGLSMDGNKKTHDIYRHDKAGNGTFKNVFKASQILKAFEVDFNILITVTRDIAKNIKEIYEFFKRNGYRYQQYIACLDPIAEGHGGRDYSLTPEIYGKFLIDLFELYFKDWRRRDFVSIRYFDNLVIRLAGGQCESCGMLGFCPSNYVLEADGSVFPCDFYVLDGFCLGNLTRDTFETIDLKRKEIRFTEKSCVVDEACKTCRYFPLCRGGCRRDREDFKTGKLGRSYLCEAYKIFFEKEADKLDYMGAMERQFTLGRNM